MVSDNFKRKSFYSVGLNEKKLVLFLEFKTCQMVTFFDSRLVDVKKLCHEQYNSVICGSQIGNKLNV